MPFRDGGDSERIQVGDIRNLLKHRYLSARSFCATNSAVSKAGTRRFRLVHSLEILRTVPSFCF
jgi:hypothetical protein